MAHHPACHKHVAGFPSRLLDLRNVEDGRIFLTDTASFPNPPPEFFTLSHCWGKTQLITTTMETLSEHQKGIAILDLPRTFADAVKVTKRLGIQYLWIDSLCIIQDSKEDWEREAQAMASIYQNSALTISATSSSDSQGGCYLEKYTGTHEAISQMTSNGYRYSVKLRDRLVGDNITKPLLSRGWVLQETVLSRRILHFTSDQIFWQCREYFLSEDFTVFDGTNGKVGLSPYGLGFIPDTDICEKNPHDRMEMWHSWIEDYSKREFTVEEDRLAALAGLIQYYQISTKDIPLVGLWASTLHQDLAWAVDDPASTRRVTGLPSWTWLSVRGWIEYSATDDIDDSSELHSPLHLIDHSFEWSGTRHVSQLIASSLTLSSKSFQLALVDRQDEYVFTLVDYKTVIVDGLTITFDTSENLEEDIRVTCLVLFHHPGTVIFLLLRPMSESRAYTRIGLGHMFIDEKNSFKSFLENLGVRTVRLV